VFARFVQYARNLPPPFDRGALHETQGALCPACSSAAGVLAKQFLFAAGKFGKINVRRFSSSTINLEESDRCVWCAVTGYAEQIIPAMMSWTASSGCSFWLRAAAFRSPDYRLKLFFRFLECS